MLYESQNYLHCLSLATGIWKAQTLSLQRITEELNNFPIYATELLNTLKRGRIKKLKIANVSGHLIYSSMPF